MPTYSDAAYVADMTGVAVGISVVINGVLSVVPLDPANSDYRNIMQLVSEGKLVIAPVEGQ